MLCLDNAIPTYLLVLFSFVSKGGKVEGKKEQKDGKWKRPSCHPPRSCATWLPWNRSGLCLHPVYRSQSPDLQDSHGLHWQSSSRLRRSSYYDCCSWTHRAPCCQPRDPGLRRPWPVLCNRLSLHCLCQYTLAELAHFTRMAWYQLRISNFKSPKRNLTGLQSSN